MSAKAFNPFERAWGWAEAAARFLGLTLFSVGLGLVFGLVAGLASGVGMAVHTPDPSAVELGVAAAYYGSLFGAASGLVLTPFFAVGMWRGQTHLGSVVAWTVLAAAAPGILPMPVSVIASWILSCTVFAALSVGHPRRHDCPARPAWRCLTCDYDLSGLPADSICPECGYSRALRMPEAYARLFKMPPSVADEGKAA